MVFYGSGLFLFQNDLIHVQAIQSGDGHGVMDDICQLFSQLRLQALVAGSFSAGLFIQDLRDLADLLHQLHKHALVDPALAVMIQQIGFQFCNGNLHLYTSCTMCFAIL